MIVRRRYIILQGENGEPTLRFSNMGAKEEETALWEGRYFYPDDRGAEKRFHGEALRALTRLSSQPRWARQRSRTHN